MVHSYYLEYYFPALAFVAKMMGQHVEKFICVSKSIENEVKRKYHFKNTTTIYNAFEDYENEHVIPIEIPKKYFLFFGRIEEKVKNFQLLLEAFLDSKLYEKEFHLLIMGDGPDVLYLEELICKLELEAYVKRIPFHKNPFEYVKKAKFTVLTSRFEGFPMSIIESLALQTPVIAVDCKSGPSELIQNEYNGLLVENYNRKALADAMNRMVNDERLYRNCVLHARKSIMHLSKETIATAWEKVLSENRFS
jgi:glycosyltransferase involved in cell wall biosynthesis